MHPAPLPSPITPMKRNECSPFCAMKQKSPSPSVAACKRSQPQPSAELHPFPPLRRQKITLEGKQQNSPSRRTCPHYPAGGGHSRYSSGIYRHTPHLTLACCCSCMQIKGDVASWLPSASDPWLKACCCGERERERDDVRQQIER